jgi:hypothetical protein
MAGVFEPPHEREHEHNRTPGADAADDKESRKRQQLAINASGWYDVAASLVSGEYDSDDKGDDDDVMEVRGV